YAHIQQVLLAQEHANTLQTQLHDRIQQFDDLAAGIQNGTGDMTALRMAVAKMMCSDVSACTVGSSILSKNLNAISQMEITGADRTKQFNPEYIPDNLLGKAFNAYGQIYAYGGFDAMHAYQQFRDQNSFNFGLSEASLSYAPSAPADP